MFGPSVTDFKEFSGRDHFLIGSRGWPGDCRLLSGLARKNRIDLTGRRQPAKDEGWSTINLKIHRRNADKLEEIDICELTRLVSYQVSRICHLPGRNGLYF